RAPVPGGTDEPAASSPSARSASPPPADPRAVPSEDPPGPGDVPPDPATGPQAPSDVAVLALPAGEVEIAAVDPGPDGLPAAAGTREGVLRVPPALLAGVAPDTHVVLTTDGTTARHVVRSAAVLTGAEASALRGSLPPSALVIVAPTGEGRWTVLVTGPAR
ncbi:MAG: hypothetical protein L0H64_16820, partial [Pseudonocardia sp.]|nr:hypothetical protein [Pseudonocardia sp.]